MVQLEHPDKDQIPAVQRLSDLPQVSPQVRLTELKQFGFLKFKILKTT